MSTALDASAIGEALLRLSSTGGQTLQQSDTLDVSVAGTEGNVMSLLAQLGNRTGMVTALPTGPLGRKVADEYRAAGIDTSAIIWRDHGRLALYFVERSVPPVPNRVIYDRDGSCFRNLSLEDIDWRYLASSRLVHLTGLTACLDEAACAIVTRAAASAREAGQRVSVDVNYRSALASPETARERIEPLLRLADVISCSRRDAEAVLGIGGEAADVARALADRYGAAALVSDATGPAVVATGDETLSVQPPFTTVVDRVGAGDALVAGFLHGYLHDDPQQGLELGVAAAALTLTRFGDQVRTTLEDLAGLAATFGTDIVR